MNREALLATAKEILTEDCVVVIEVSRGYMEKLRAWQSRPENWPKPLIPYTFSPLIPENAAVLRYKSGKVTMVYQNGDMLAFPDQFNSLIDSR